MIAKHVQNVAAPATLQLLLNQIFRFLSHLPYHPSGLTGVCPSYCETDESYQTSVIIVSMPHDYIEFATSILLLAADVVPDNFLH